MCNRQEVKSVCCGFPWCFLLYTLTSFLAVGVLFLPLSACWFLCRKGLNSLAFLSESLGFRSLQNFNFVDPSLAERDEALKESYSTSRELKFVLVKYMI